MGKWIVRRRPSAGTTFGFAALVVALGGAAFAAIPDSSGTIHGCYQKANGNLRVVESASEAVRVTARDGHRGKGCQHRSRDQPFSAALPRRGWCTHPSQQRYLDTAR